MSCYCNLPAKSYTCLTTGYKYYRCPRTKNDWNFKNKKWFVTESKIQPCNFRKIKKKFSSTHKALNYSWKKWLPEHYKIMSKRKKWVNTKRAYQNTFDHVFRVQNLQHRRFLLE